MAQLPIVVGDVYLIGGVARLKILISIAGLPAIGLSPTVTIIRDSDDFALNAVLGVFEAPASIGDLSDSRFKIGPLTELGLGYYYYDFDPVTFSSAGEHVYTVIFENTTPGAPIIAKSEFTFSNTFGAQTTGFGFVDREKTVCANEPVKISYQATSGLGSNVLLTIYNPYDDLVFSATPMPELEATGVYVFPYTFTVEGDHLLLVSESVHGSRDAMQLTVGGNASRIKRIEAMVRDLIKNPPTVTPCP